MPPESAAPQVVYSILASLALLYAAFTVGLDYFKGQYDDVGTLVAYTSVTLTAIVLSALCACVAVQDAQELRAAAKGPAPPQFRFASV